MSTRKKIVGIMSIILIVLIGFYVYKSMSYQTKFMPKTKVDGMSFENKTVAEANSALQEYYRTKEFSVTENETEIFKFQGADIGITEDFTKKLTQLKKEQNSWSWPVRLLTNTSQKSEMNDVTYDETTFNQFFNELPLVNEERVKPENAKIEKNATGFVLKPEIDGNTFDLNKVRQVLVSAIDKGETKINLDGNYQKPTLYADNPDLKANFNQLDSVTKETVSYTINGVTETVSPEKLLSWVNVNPENKMTIDESAIATYIGELNTKYSTKAKTRSFKSSKRGEVQVPPGIYGWNLLVTKEATSLTSDIATQTNLQNRDPQHEGSGYGGDIGNTYVEVDLTAQHMWFYRDGALVLETDIVSGKPSTPTPPGTFYIWNREPNAILRGEDYATPVKYWMPIDWDGVGIHDSSWQPAYGGDLHLTKGSHGCINTPPGVMAQLFDAAPVGTPVLVF
ncbi:L,D-transpeptidase family protein [Carnobacterium gallinarum]|uniref:L,D-transpeptidase family protein n=1 Tax=Carnobacterium gallinarum TaxID=2749 RepID=UPI0005515A50|nr:L,D-transpeptidase family protein [Carnobacterium gallinarum]